MSHFFKLPTYQPYSGEAGYAFINPSQVSALEPDEIDIGEETMNSKTMTGTRVVTSQEIYFVPLTVAEVADKLDIELHGQEKEAVA